MPSTTRTQDQVGQESTEALGGLGSLPQAATVHVYDHVYQLLRHAIISHDVRSGTRLVESELATRLQVSRTPIRDALRRLESDGLVQRTPRGGLVATTFSPDEISDIFLVRTELDRLAAKLASERTGPEAWEPARKLAKELDVFAKRYGSTSYQFSQAHQRVHAEIYRLAFASRVASMLNERLLGLVAIASDLSYAEDRPDEPVVAQHLELIDALASGDPERALLAADAHTAQAAVDALGLS